MKELEKILSKEYIDFLKTSRINIDDRNVFNQKDCFFIIKEFYTLSDKDTLININEEYDGRFRKGFFIIADADNGDYLLMNQDGNVFFWNHEINDLGYDLKATVPIMISKNISEFLSLLVKNKDFDIEPEVKSIKLSDDFNDLFKDYLK